MAGEFGVAAAVPGYDANGGVVLVFGPAGVVEGGGEVDGLSFGAGEAGVNGENDFLRTGECGVPCWQAGVLGGSVECDEGQEQPNY